MSYAYHNFRNLYPDKYGRQQAHNNYNYSNYLGQQAHNQNVNYAKDMLKYGFGDPDAKREMQMTLSQWTPYEQESAMYGNYAQQSMQNAYVNEQAALMDRQADWYENQMASKNNSDALAFRAMMERTAAQERMNKQNADALSSMTTSLTAPSFGNGNTPGTGLYDNNNKRVGGSTPFYNGGGKYYG
jgi:aspartyl-tRNA synthetase